MRSKLKLLFYLVICSAGLAQSQQTQTELLAQKFQPIKAPQAAALVLRHGDRLAICGDSITEQKMYSRIMEDYLTMCVPELEVTVRQFGWSGERAPGFLARMTNDCLRFKPSVATTCYGMNDHEYRPYEERIGDTYRSSSAAVIEAFKANGVRVIQGSPGCVGKIPFWVKSATGTVDELNANLCKLRNIGIEMAQTEKVGFADVFWPMLTAGVSGQQQFGTNFAIAGKDGVHPGWAGQTVMAYAFLKALGINGDIGVFTIDLKKGQIKTTQGHKVISAKDNAFEIESSRYPFCACVEGSGSGDSYPTCASADDSSDSSLRSAMRLIPFNQELNQLILIAKNGKARSYNVSWGPQTRTFSADQLSHGINLASEFPSNPFCAAFGKVDAAIAAKQAYETKQIKEIFRGPEAKSDMEAVAARTEREREPLAAAIKQAFVPVRHVLQIEPQT